MLRLTGSLAITMLCATSPALAQDAVAAARDRGWGFEVGGGVAMLLNAEGSVRCPVLQARVNVARNVAIEAASCIAEDDGGLAGFYLLQAHHNLGAHSRVTPFVTYGVAGGFSYDRVAEYRYELDTGDIVVTPAHTERYLSRPLAAIAGGGVRVRLAPHAFLETGGQIWILEDYTLVGLFAGVSVPLGRRR